MYTFKSITRFYPVHTSHILPYMFPYILSFCYILLYIVTILSLSDPIRNPEDIYHGYPKKRSESIVFPMGFPMGFPMLPSNFWVTPTFRGAGRRILPSGAHGQGAEGPADGWPIQANLKSVDMQRSDIITSILCVYSICIICILIIIPHCV
jgi:hypothetical protein